MTIDEAWAECVAALPKGWLGPSLDAYYPEGWEAFAHHADAPPGESDRGIGATWGATPVEALLALAEKLRNFKPRRRCAVCGNVGRNRTCHPTAAPTAEQQERAKWRANERADRAEARVLSLEEALRWALRNRGGECPADYPDGYKLAKRVLEGKDWWPLRPAAVRRDHDAMELEGSS